MSNQSRLEYIELLRKRYQNSTRKMRSQILSEICINLELHRKHAIRLMNKLRFIRQGQRGRKKIYSKEAFYHLSRLWHAMGQMGSKKMKAALPEWIPHYKLVDARRSL